MMFRILCSILILLYSTSIDARSYDGGKPRLPKEVRGICMGLPSYKGIDPFIRFIEMELVPRKLNVLVLRVDYGYRYQSHPELVNTAKREDDSTQSVALTREEMKRIVKACRSNGITLVPLVNLFGHQSWAGNLGAMLRAYPEFDETPWVKLPAEYKWPNADSLYCKSYCPNHPGVHKVVFDLVDEIMEVCETRHFHAGMDEVFYIGMAGCPRCGGKDRSELFAQEVNRIRDHVKSKKGRLWIWGDRMIDAKSTGLGIWEASGNDTHRSIDMIKKDVVINDWHYVSSPKTAEAFAQKGYSVMMCPWNRPEVAKTQVADYRKYKASGDRRETRNHHGFIQTVWTGTENFLDMFYGKTEEKKGSTVQCFKTLFSEMDATASPVR
jgi:hypothetical protein